MGMVGNNVCVNNRGFSSEHPPMGVAGGGGGVGNNGFYCINGGNVPGGGWRPTQQTPTTLSSPWHPHPPTMGQHQPPSLMPHPTQDQHGPLAAHDNGIVALNDVDLNDESATSDLATSFFGYRWEFIRDHLFSMYAILFKCEVREDVPDT